MRFDRTAPSGGIEAVCRLENGKVILDWEFHLIQYVNKQEIKVPVPQKCEEERRLLLNENGYIRLYITDRRGSFVLECIQKLCEEEPLQSILLQPELWKGLRDPCLYGMEAILMDERGKVRDRIQGKLALRCLHCSEKNGKTELFLNQERFEPKAVRYALPETGTDAAIQRQMLEDLEWMRKLGANCVCIEYASGTCPNWEEESGGKACSGIISEEYSRNSAGTCLSGERSRNASEAFAGRRQSRTAKIRTLFLKLCDRCGILVFRKNKKQPGYAWANGQMTGVWKPSKEEIPSFRGSKDSLFLPDDSCPTSLFYKFQARWSETPFVHIGPESIRRLASGNFTALCYSNCDRVALYSDGSLMEFKNGEEEFLFREIPVRTPSIMLTAESEGCSHSLSLHKSFIK